MSAMSDIFVWAELPCAVLKGPLGCWNGYVGVPSAHPDHGRDYSDVDVDVHGGLTYGCASLPGDGEVPQGFFWFGFDTAHYGDYVPGSFGVLGREGEYRDHDYVERETKHLAEQLAVRMASPEPVR